MHYSHFLDPTGWMTSQESDQANERTKKEALRPCDGCGVAFDESELKDYTPPGTEQYLSTTCKPYHLCVECLDEWVRAEQEE